MKISFLKNSMKQQHKNNTSTVPNPKNINNGLFTHHLLVLNTLHTNDEINGDSCIRYTANVSGEINKTTFFTTLFFYIKI